MVQRAMVTVMKSFSSVLSSEISGISNFALGGIARQKQSLGRKVARLNRLSYKKSQTLGGDIDGKRGYHGASICASGSISWRGSPASGNGLNTEATQVLRVLTGLRRDVQQLVDGIEHGMRVIDADIGEQPAMDRTVFRMLLPEVGCLGLERSQQRFGRCRQGGACRTRSRFAPASGQHLKPLIAQRPQGFSR